MRFLCNKLPIKHFYLEANNEEYQLSEILKNESVSPFNLEDDLLLRLTIIHCPQNRDIVVFTIHHLITDAWSMDILKKDFHFYYNKHRNQLTDELPKLSNSV